LTEVCFGAVENRANTVNKGISGAAEADEFKIGYPSIERVKAVNEVGAAIAHALNGPLTALLFYVGDLNQNSDQFPEGNGDGQSLKQVAANALREAERVCFLMQRITDAFEAPLNKETAVAHGREVIRWFSHVSEEGEAAVQAAAVVQERLTPRERDVLRLVIEGCSNKEGAIRLQISYRTFESHRAHVMRKLGAKNAVELMKLALLTPAALRDLLPTDDNSIGSVQA
jgi:DNA-binding CsgD family transcriptional regulator